MDSGESTRGLIRRVVAALDRAAIPYMLTGSLASSFHGEPRSTQDIDIVIDPEKDSLERLLSAFPTDDYYVSREAALSALEVRGFFNVVDLQTGWKVDFIIRKDRAFSRTEFERRQSDELFGIRLHIASPEDVILVKLEWAKISDSDRQIRDAAGILRLKGDAINFAYIQGWVGVLDIRDQWDLAKARLD